MNRKIFLSFLGTGNYLNCNYDEINNCKYIQEALIKKYCINWGKNEAIYIFLTKEAEEKHWKELKQTIDWLNIQAQLIPIKNVPSGKSEEEIWEIFKIVFNCLKDKDEIIYDITHSFRSLPMLGMTLLNYAKFLKNVTVNGIYYGAFEVIGNNIDIGNMEIEKRNAPIFNLTEFSNLQDWSVAADNFVNLGNAEKMSEILLQYSMEKLKETKGKDKEAEKIKHLANNLTKIISYIKAVRGNELIEMKELKIIKLLINEIREHSNYKTKPLIPLLFKIEEKLEDFKANCISNGFVAVKWCIEHNLIQQGITLLQEFVVTYIALNLNLNYISKLDRELVKSALHIVYRELPEKDWRVEEKDKSRLKQIMSSTYANNFATSFKKLTDFRNNLNHAGFSNDVIDMQKFKDHLTLSYNDIQKLINEV